MQAKQWTGINNSKRQTFRVTFLATKAYSELQRSDGSWQLIGTWTDPTYWQPLRGYHVEAALAISSAGGAKNDPGRGDATRKISNLKVWSGTDPGGGGTDTDPAYTEPADRSDSAGAGRRSYRAGQPTLLARTPARASTTTRCSGRMTRSRHRAPPMFQRSSPSTT
jgi:hypothetical protein